MKRILTAALALVLAFGLLSTTVLAADGPKSGICDVVITTEGKELGYSFDFGSIKPTTDIANHKKVYLGAEYFMLTSSNAGDGYKLVLTQKGDGVPTMDNLVYINQSEDTANVSFKIYPSKLSADGTYYVYISSSAGTGRTLVATFSYYQEYKLGDVNSDGDIDITDALNLLQSIAKNITFTDVQNAAADVNKDGSVDVLDVMNVLQYIAKNITSFD